MPPCGCCRALFPPAAHRLCRPPRAGTGPLRAESRTGLRALDARLKRGPTSLSDRGRAPGRPFPPTRNLSRGISAFSVLTGPCRSASPNTLTSASCTTGTSLSPPSATSFTIGCCRSSSVPGRTRRRQWTSTGLTTNTGRSFAGGLIGLGMDSLLDRDDDKVPRPGQTLLRGAAGSPSPERGRVGGDHPGLFWCSD